MAGPRSKFERAFTLIELLVVIAIIGILAALLLSAMAGAKERAVRVKCLNNVKQFTYAMITYGQDNGERLPPVLFDNEPWAIHESLAGQLGRYGIRREMLHDPAYPEKNIDSAWNHEGMEHLIGYILTLPGSPGILSSELNARIYPEPIQMATLLLPAPNASERVLVGGLVISAAGQNKTDADSRASYNYSVIAGDGDDSPQPARSSHLDRRRRLPTGDNEGMLDGGAKWRKFGVMKPRSYATIPVVVWW